MKSTLKFAFAVALTIGLGAQPFANAAVLPTVNGIPRLDHVFVIVLENESITKTWYSSGTYLESLRSQGVFASRYFGSSHLSADNYMTMTSGQMPTPLFNADCPDWSKCETWEASRPDQGVSITDQIDNAGKSWKGYMDEMGTPCLHPAPDSMTSPYNSDPYQSGYATRHDPFMYYPSIVGRQSYCDQHVVDYSALGADLASESTTQNYSFIVPDTCHDGHDSPCTGADHFAPGGSKGGLVSTNLWMSTEVPKILASPAFTTPGVASVLLITTDESANTDVLGCAVPPSVDQPPGTCSSGVPPVGITGGGNVGLLAIGSPAANLAPAGSETTTGYDHASMLRTVEDGLRLPAFTNPLVAQDSSGHLNEAGSPLEHSMSTLFNN